MSLIAQASLSNMQSSPSAIMDEFEGSNKKIEKLLKKAERENTEKPKGLKGRIKGIFGGSHKKFEKCE